MPRLEVYEALPSQQKQVMRDTQITPVVNRRQRCCYRCNACGAEWSEGSTKGPFRLWWACPNECNWETYPGLANVMRNMAATIARPYQEPRLQGQRASIVDSHRVTLEVWSQAVDKLVAEVERHG